MIEETKKLLEQVKAKNMASDRQCTKCVCYVARYKDDYTVRNFSYGEVKIRPTCSLFPGKYVSHNPAAYCSDYKEKKSEKSN